MTALDRPDMTDDTENTEAITLGLHDASPQHLVEKMADDVVVEMGWGRLIFGQTFADPNTLAEVLRQESLGRRDICIYAREPHVLVSLAPAELFIDPSHTYRLRFSDDDEPAPSPTGFSVMPLRNQNDADEMNRVYVRCGMVPAPVEVLWDNHLHHDAVDYLIAVRDDDGTVVGTVTGVDHKRLFSDPENGSSLWTLAVDPSSSLPGVGAALTRALAAIYRDRGRAYMDLSVSHDNAAAIALYEKLGFERVPVMAVKRKNAINEPLFTHAPETVEDLNPYARIIADEAMRRGIFVEVLDAEAGEMRLSHGGRSVITRESLSEFTSAVAMARCDDKRLTRRLVAEAGIVVPKGRLATFDEQDIAFLEEVGDVVVKPTRGEQGKGITVGVTGAEELTAALARAREEHPHVLIEQRAPGDDLRLVAIDGKVVAAAIRRPAEIIGTGHHTIRELIEAQSRRRAAATGGESRIPIDAVTEATVAEAGWGFDDVLPEGQRLRVRRTANLHQGGTIHDVTAKVHPHLCEVAVKAAEAIGIPVTGIDLIVPDVTEPEYVFIEANERPGLANHEPQPTAKAFVDFLFPGSPALPQAWTPAEAPD
ncbi:GNAT-family acetyltransferase TIGR03103 [Mycolicibacterium phlei]|uniref:Acetyltransferase n=1 Tax=Mycolicibacterium phlei DSM 43239 = CCUG 21000 TaxID=1226750 RepID=A0A5N5UZ25_MYCPH|nr:N-acetylglutaminylglutamine synthetase [Mycolicibacterium phlei]VEG09151.1 GNAT-family acetyltransferase TIGR03103 [Mycobacteroides chelonae]AMO61035.1 Cyanophycin synthetase [Mycolicibacterium phlei]KAB7754854.1 acetyltransferase [Mycolicibacterium phlei DSM 43239 = CCUG 21000]KXW64434.1 acetyltransferase [Mycolicibacterium phlei DSM 43239 = CCUG 21000]KXW67149.1 acetyltransferase [Mycolicibacterium phlei DSM 43072]